MTSIDRTTLNDEQDSQLTIAAHIVKASNTSLDIVLSLAGRKVGLAGNVVALGEIFTNTINQEQVSPNPEPDVYTTLGRRNHNDLFEDPNCQK